MLQRLAVDDQGLADVPHRMRSGTGAYFLEQTFALRPIPSGELDFDEFVALQAAIDFGQDPGGEPGVADDDHRLQRMGTGLERAPLGGCEWVHRRDFK